MLKVGLTGGIGSGKSTVAKMFETLGIPVYYADERAKALMSEDEELKEKIQQTFGMETYADGKLDRAYLSAMVFNDVKKLERLNELVHPSTLKDADKWMQEQTTSYVIKEAALIFESGSQEFLDHVIGVYAPAPLRIQRVMDRDNVSKEAVKARMSKQIQEEIKMRLCDFVIINDEQQLLIPQVLELHQKFLVSSF